MRTITHEVKWFRATDARYNRKYIFFTIKKKKKKKKKIRFDELHLIIIPCQLFPSPVRIQVNSVSVRQMVSSTECGDQMLKTTFRDQVSFLASLDWLQKRTCCNRLPAPRQEMGWLWVTSLTHPVKIPSLEAIYIRTAHRRPFPAHGNV